MKKIYFYAILLLSGIANSQITLIKDINFTNFATTAHSSPDKLFAFDGKLYFSADDSFASNTGDVDVGKELWVSDGTDAGTTLVKDINVGDENSSPQSFFILKNELYFYANDGDHNIYKTDGTEEGTLAQGINYQINTPIVIGDKAYMQVYFDVLYEYDGETFQKLPDMGTGEVTDAGSSYIALDDNSILCHVKYEIAGTSVGKELYLYDIPNQSYTLVKDFDGTAADADLNYFAKLGNKVYFTNEGDTTLWETDGTPDGTKQVAAASSVSDVNYTYAWNGKLYFDGKLGTYDQLISYDPATGTVTELSTITANHHPDDFADPGDGYLYYGGKAYPLSPGNQRRLYRTNGTTVQAIDLDSFDRVDEITAVGNKLYFEASYDTDQNPTGPADIGRELFGVDTSLLTTLSASEFELDSSLSIYPNPSTNLLNVKTTLEGEINYTIYNIAGKKVLSGTIENDVINHNLTIGLYLLKLDNGSNSVSKKIVVKN
ncbi:T9SS type A sorting domain-containing protein [Flavivirga jejuensis]|uniref:T9SS type A sorting domain-containing protein n=1 Tax=Flavivirga jejuensis TaxID=870487 RepID=A0ABT8WL53_9FLAO|nr:T9SS type A sorting domain-containing protein [Flavivirga jejuensis]MDO5973780.1 T9SS type A sorting domain-containing protein [Flavivirga jejuensis]